MRVTGVLLAVIAAVANSGGEPHESDLGVAVSTSPHFLFFNRIPKAGSTTMISLLRHLARRREERKGTGKYAGKLYKVWNSQRPDYKLQRPFESGTRWSEGWERIRQMQAESNSTQGIVYINHVYHPNFTVRRLTLDASEWLL
jgi:hypothetical protein